MPKPKRIPYLSTVTSIVDLSPSIRRLTLKSENPSQFGTESVGGYFKFVFAANGSTDISGLSEDQKPLLRTYTIRDYNENTGEITVDLVRHVTNDMSCGFASRWVETVSESDTISLVGPGKSAYPAFDHDAIFCVADMTALPSLSVVLKQLPASMTGQAVIEVATKEDIQPLSAPEGINITWVISSDNQSLAETAKAQQWPEGVVDVWCACEFDTMKALRQYFRNERNVEKDNIYISSFWKNGVAEDGHKVLKRQDLENNG